MAFGCFPREVDRYPLPPSLVRFRAGDDPAASDHRRSSAAPFACLERTHAPKICALGSLAPMRRARHRSLPSSGGGLPPSPLPSPFLARIKQSVLNTKAFQTDDNNRPIGSYKITADVKSSGGVVCVRRVRAQRFPHGSIRTAASARSPTPPLMPSRPPPRNESHLIFDGGKTGREASGFASARSQAVTPP